MDVPFAQDAAAVAGGVAGGGIEDAAAGAIFGAFVVCLKTAWGEVEQADAFADLAVVAAEGGGDFGDGGVVVFAHGGDPGVFGGGEGFPGAEFSP